MAGRKRGAADSAKSGRGSASRRPPGGLEGSEGSEGREEGAASVNAIHCGRRRSTWAGGSRPERLVGVEARGRRLSSWSSPSLSDRDFDTGWRKSKRQKYASSAGEQISKTDAGPLRSPGAPANWLPTGKSPPTHWCNWCNPPLTAPLFFLSSLSRPVPSVIFTCDRPTLSSTPFPLSDPLSLPLGSISVCAHRCSRELTLTPEHYVVARHSCLLRSSRLAQLPDSGCSATHSPGCSRKHLGRILLVFSRRDDPHGPANGEPPPWHGSPVPWRQWLCSPLPPFF